MQEAKEAASEFLANERIAVTGVSRTPQGHGSNIVYQRLRERGHEVLAVNPNAQQGVTVIDGGCPLMFDPTADAGHKAIRLWCSPTGEIPKHV